MSRRSGSSTTRLARGRSRTSRASDSPAGTSRGVPEAHEASPWRHSQVAGCSLLRGPAAVSGLLGGAENTASDEVRGAEKRHIKLEYPPRHGDLREGDRARPAIHRAHPGDPVGHRSTAHSHHRRMAPLPARRHPTGIIRGGTKWHGLTGGNISRRLRSDGLRRPARTRRQPATTWWPARWCSTCWEMGGFAGVGSVDRVRDHRAAVPGKLLCDRLA